MNTCKSFAYRCISYILLNTFIKQCMKNFLYGILIVCCFPVTIHGMNKSKTITEQQLTDAELAKQLDDALTSLLLSRTSNLGEAQSSALPKASETTLEQPSSAHAAASSPSSRLLRPLVEAHYPDSTSVSNASSTGTSASPTPSTHSEEFKILNKFNFLPYDPQPDSARQKTPTKIHPGDQARRALILDQGERAVLEAAEVDFALKQESGSPEQQRGKHSLGARPSAAKAARRAIQLTAEDKARLLEEQPGISAPPSSPRRIEGVSGPQSASSSRNHSPFSPATVSQPVHAPSDRMVHAAASSQNKSQKPKLARQTGTTALTGPSLRLSEPSKPMPTAREPHLLAPPRPPSKLTLLSTQGEHSNQDGQSKTAEPKQSAIGSRRRSVTLSSFRSSSSAPGTPSHGKPVAHTQSHTLDAILNNFERTPQTVRSPVNPLVTATEHTEFRPFHPRFLNPLMENISKKKTDRALLEKALETMGKKIDTLPPEAQDLTRAYLLKIIHRSYINFLRRYDIPLRHTCVLKLDEKKFITTMSMPPDGGKVFIAAEEDIHLLDLSNPTKPVELAMIHDETSESAKEHAKQISSSQFSRNGKWLITRGNNGTVVVWGLRNIRRIEAHEFSSSESKHQHLVGSASICDDARFAVSSHGEIATFHDARYIYGVESTKLRGHTRNVPKVIISDDGSCGVSGGRDEAIWWDFSKPGEVVGLRLKDMEFIPIKQKTPKEATEGQLKAKKPKSPKKPSEPLTNEIFSLTCSADAQIVVTARMTNLTIWDMKHKRAYPMKIPDDELLPKDEIITLALSGRWVMAGTSLGTVWVFDISNIENTACFKIAEHSPCVRIEKIAIGPSGRLAAFLTYHVDPKRQQLILCDLRNLKEPKLHRIETHTKPAQDICIASNDTFLTRASDGTLLLFDLSPGANFSLAEIAQTLIRARSAEEDEASDIID